MFERAAPLVGCVVGGSDRLLNEDGQHWAQPGLLVGSCDHEDGVVAGQPLGDVDLARR